MAPDGRTASKDDVWTEPEPSLAELFDPVALEERLKEARIRRAAAIERRRSGADADAPATGVPVLPATSRRPLPPLPPLPLREAAAPVPAAPKAAPEAPPAEPEPEARRVGILARVAAVPVWITFLAGLGLGAAAVAMVVLFGRPPAETPQATTTTATATATIAATAPEVPVGEIAPPAQPAQALPANADVRLGTVGSAVATPPADLAEPASEIAAAVPAASLNPAALPEAAEPAAAAPEAAPPAAAALEAEAPEVTASVAPALPPRATVHFPTSARAEAERAAETLRAAGVAVETVAVPYSIARTNVRYYHAVDQGSAENLSGLLAPDLPGEPPLTRDFTSYATPAAPGRVEIWLAGTPDGARAAASAPVRSPSPVRAATPRATEAPRTTPEPTGLPSNPAVYDPAGPAPVAIPPSQAEEIARIVVERAYERLLQQAPTP